MRALHFTRVHSSREEYSRLIEFETALIAKYLCFLGVFSELREDAVALQFFLALMCIVIFASYCDQFKVSKFFRVTEQLAMEVNFIRHSRTVFDLLLVICEIVHRVFVAPWLHKAKIRERIRIFCCYLMVEMDLQAILPVLYRRYKRSLVRATEMDESHYCDKITYIPRDFAVDSFEFTLSADTIKWLQTSRIKRSLEVHVLDVEVDQLATLNALDGEVEPRAKARILVVRHRVAGHPYIELI